MSLALTPLLSTLAGIAALIAGLALLVQIIQEVYKHLTSSKARTYRRVLEDFAGAWIRQPQTQHPVSGLLGRMPFHLARPRLDGELLPLDRETLVAAAERTAPVWIRRALQALSLEAELQATGAETETKSDPLKPSPQWAAFLESLWSASPGAPDERSALEVRALLERWDAAAVDAPQDQAPEARPPRQLDARRLLTALRHELLPHVVHLQAHHHQLERQMDYAYRRRNLRQTFTIALVLAVVCNLPFDRLYRRAAAMPVAEAMTLLQQSTADPPSQDVTSAEAATSQTEPVQESPSSPGSGKAAAATLEPPQGRQDALDAAKRLLAQATGSGTADSEPHYLISPDQLRRLIRDPMEGLRFLLGCLITSLAITFGAPLINDLAGVVFRLQQQAGPGQRQGTP